MLILWTFLGVVGIFVALVIIVIATPMHLRLVAAAGENAGVRAEVRTFWGLSPRLKLETKKRGDDATAKPRRRKSRTRGKRRRGGIGAEDAMRMLKALPETAVTVFRRIHVDRLRLRATFGFDDPAATGEVFGMLTPWVYALPTDRCDLQVRPDFVRPRFDGSAEVWVRLTPLAVVWPVLRLGLVVWRMRR